MKKATNSNLEKHIPYIQQVLSLASHSTNPSPNPKVGALIVKNGKILSTGYHQGPGKNHAEIDALQKIHFKAKEATLYLNLEPCCHLNKRTPPCLARVIESGIKKIVISSLDPNPAVNGKSIAALKKAGIEVIVGLAKEENEFLNRFFFHRMKFQKPYILLKAALSLDGKIALANGESKWISNERSRIQAHKTRAEVDAIWVSPGTAKKDNPLLSVRNVEGKNPLRIVVDPHLTLSSKLNLFQCTPTHQTLLCTLKANEHSNKHTKLKKQGVEFLFYSHTGANIPYPKILKQISKRPIQSILLEGGPSLWGSFLKENLVDELQLYLAPFFMGEGQQDLLKEYRLKNLKQRQNWEIKKIEKFRDDLYLIYQKKN